MDEMQTEKGAKFQTWSNVYVSPSLSNILEKIGKIIIGLDTSQASVKIALKLISMYYEIPPFQD